MRENPKAFICFDLGDTIMIEETEEKDMDEVTTRANLIGGLPAILHGLYEERVLLGLIADTKIGTYHNVLHQHGLFALFSVFSISDELGVSKPHPLMFHHALAQAKRLGFRGDRALMVGNNYFRDIIGGRDAGFDTCWFHWNERYPFDPTREAADGIVTSVAQLEGWIRGWLDNSHQFVKEAGV